jgi:hypothetical protein
LPADPEVTTRHGDVAGDLVGVLKKREAMLHMAIYL